MILYQFFVCRNSRVKYEYERYVQEHLTEHYDNRLKQWKILVKLNWHYCVKKRTEPLIYWDNVPSTYIVDEFQIQNSVSNECENCIEALNYWSADSKSNLIDESKLSNRIICEYETNIKPGLKLLDDILYGLPEHTKVLLCPYAGTGDVYLASMYINAYAEKSNIKCFVVTVIGGANYKIAQLFGFERTQKVDQAGADHLLRLSMFLGKDNDKIIILHHHAPQNYCGIMEYLRNINKLNFIDMYIHNVFGLDEKKDRQLPLYDYESDEITKLFYDNNLKEGQTVILSPYVNTLPPLPWWVWVHLAQKLNELGFVVCTNCGGPNEKEIDGTIPLYFGYDIAVPMLEKCGYFVGVRSGFCDVISSAQCKKIIIYQPYIFWGEGTNMDYFSLNVNGFCEDAVEIEYHGVEFLQLIDEVVNNMNTEVNVNENKNKEKNNINELEYIIVQAGGKGTRLGYLTKNRPKALVPVNNLPILFHLFKRYPNKKFIIIGDYKFEVLRDYLAAFAEVDYEIVNAMGKEGTCGGLSEALKHIPDNTKFMLIWSDLVLPETFRLDFLKNDNYVGISEDFSCRWKYEDGKFVEERSKKNGVAGLFVFKDKKLLNNVPESGEFVRWLSENNEIVFSTTGLAKTNEYGLLDDYNRLDPQKCRPFNSLEIKGTTIIKRGIDEQGIKLGIREAAWYKKVHNSKFVNLPQIYSYSPLTMEKVEGKNIYEYTDLAHKEKLSILKQIIECLKQLHTIEKVEVDKSSFDEAYIGKTISRLEKVRNLVPFANDKIITINGRKCRNFFYYIEDVRQILEKYVPKSFSFIHGDCTFSNMMLRQNGEPVLIDPRGYFGKTEFYGDTAYDWAKLYYSIVGNYDQFNLKRFRLEINQTDVQLSIQSSGWEDMEDVFFELLDKEVSKEQIKLIHAIIWLSLTTYAWEDYDSICGAFYNGLFYLEEVL